MHPSILIPCRMLTLKPRTIPLSTCICTSGKWCNAWVLENRTKLRITNLDIMMRSWCILSVKSAPHSQSSYEDFKPAFKLSKMTVTDVSYHKLPQFARRWCKVSQFIRCRCKLFLTASGLCGLSQALQGCLNLAQNFVKLPLVITEYRPSEAVWSCPWLSQAFRWLLNQVSEVT